VDPLDRVRAASSAIKVFPLPQAVLFPSTALPLHIFEPRYRALVRDCLASDGVMAMAQLQPGWQPHDQERPALQPLACAGLVVAHEALEGGRFNIILHGVVRIRILAELPAAKLYREVQAEVLEDPPYSGLEEQMIRQALLEMGSRLPREAAEGLLQMASQHSGGGLGDVVAAALILDPERRQRILAELDVKRRLGLVLEDVSGLMAQLSPQKPTLPS
jgi:hypothetical protein